VATVKAAIADGMFIGQPDEFLRPFNEAGCCSGLGRAWILIARSSFCYYVGWRCGYSLVAAPPPSA
jgi:hypothetical protein